MECEDLMNILEISSIEFSNKKKECSKILAQAKSFRKEHETDLNKCVSKHNDIINPVGDRIYKAW
jgi:hypothetical protein